MRLPGAALLIVIGLFVLWLATTGQLDRLATAWDYVKSDKPLPKVADASGSGSGGSGFFTPSGVVDSSRYHVSALMQTLDPVTDFQPGGTL